LHKRPLDVRNSTLIPQTLADFARQPGCIEGLSLSVLAPGTTVSVITRHSHYRVTVIDPLQGHALVTSALWFPEPTEVRLEGATAGGSALKTGWIGIGLKLEMSVLRQRVTTSRVVSVAVVDVPPDVRRRDNMSGLRRDDSDV
jgi:hypothetical protein